MKTPRYKNSDQYIQACPEQVRGRLMEMRTAIMSAAPGCTESLARFDIPGYAYYDKGYEYSGMFAWFSFKAPYVRLHVIPPVIDDYRRELAGYSTTKSVVNFPTDKQLPIELVQELVRASIKAMKEEHH